MGLVDSGFLTRNNFSENYQQFGHARLKTSASPLFGWEYLKNIGFSGRQIFSLREAPTCLGPT